ncbi:MAG: hypothetical protein ACXU8N_02040 [Telluria sp.]
MADPVGPKVENGRAHVPQSRNRTIFGQARQRVFDIFDSCRHLHPVLPVREDVWEAGLAEGVGPAARHAHAAKSVDFHDGAGRFRSKLKAVQRMASTIFDFAGRFQSKTKG